MKSFKHILLIVAISLIPFISVFSDTRMIHTHDGPMHLARAPAYYKALTGGQILPRWAGNLNYSYGMPLFNFYYHMPYLIASAFIALGTNLTVSFKLTMLVSFILSGVGMYLFSEAFFKDRRKALLTAVLFQFAPFHLTDMVVRGNSGEMLAMSFFTFALWGIWKLLKQAHSRKYFVFTGVATALMILSHSAISLMYFGILVCFIPVFSTENSARKRAYLSLGLGLLLTAFYWIPVLLERRYTYGDYYTKDFYTAQMTPLWRFFIPNLTNDARLQTGGVDISFGLMQTFALGTGVLLLVRKRLAENEKRIVLFTAGLTLFSTLLMTTASFFLWKHISILRAFQFPWRFLSIPVFALALLGGTVLIRKRTPSYLFAVFIITALCTGIVYLKPPLGFDRINEEYFWNYPLDTTFFGETNLRWSAGHESKYPEKPVEVIGGVATVSGLTKNEIKHVYTIAADTDTWIRDNTQYYPGWRVYDGTMKVPIEFQDPNNRGIITYRLTPGMHHITVSFGETPLRAFAEIITVSTIIAIGYILLVPAIKRNSV